MKKFILLLLAVAAFQSCSFLGNVQDYDLHGTWVYDTTTQTITITFNNDGTFVRTLINRTTLGSFLNSDTITGEYAVFMDTVELEFDYYERWEYDVTLNYISDEMNLAGYEGSTYTNRTYIRSY